MQSWIKRLICIALIDMKKKYICTNRIIHIIIACSLCLFFSCTAEKKVINIESLLEEMVKRDLWTSYPETNFRLKQESSYNRASKTPDDPEGWFANADLNNGKTTNNFIRIDEINGEKEWVLMDHYGPGAIVRTWMPFRSIKKPDTDIQIRIYLDGAEEPVLEGNMLGLLNGSGIFPYPFAHKSLRSAVSFFPIPYAKSCKVTTTAEPFFYQFTFREYEEGTEINTFTLADFENAQALIQKVGNSLINPQNVCTEQQLSVSEIVEAKKSHSIDLPEGKSAIKTLSVNLRDYSDPEITRKVLLHIEFDGITRVWCPLGDFFGSGIGLNPYQGWYRTVAEDGTLSCRWVMPYQKSAKLTIINYSDRPVELNLIAGIDDWKWTESSMYFNAGWRGQYPLATQPPSDWNYVTLHGRGVYVGDALTVMNPVTRWWGEGDEKIWVDGEEFPSIFGTGTEDYYAYSWGGRSTDFYEHPFHAQPHCYIYNKLNRKTLAGEANSSGYSTETRTRALDVIPFESELKLDMEVWSWSDCDMGYGVATYWYGDVNTSSNLNKDVQEVLNVPPLPQEFNEQ